MVRRRVGCCAIVWARGIKNGIRRALETAVFVARDAVWQIFPMRTCPERILSVNYPVGSLRGSALIPGSVLPVGCRVRRRATGFLQLP